MRRRTLHAGRQRIQPRPQSGSDRGRPSVVTASCQSFSLDSYANFWNLAWCSEALRHGWNLFETHLLYFPTGSSLALTEFCPLYGVLSAPLLQVWHTPQAAVAAFNGWLAVSFVLCRSESGPWSSFRSPCWGCPSRRARRCSARGTATRSISSRTVGRSWGTRCSGPRQRRLPTCASTTCRGVFRARAECRPHWPS